MSLADPPLSVVATVSSSMAPFGASSMAVNDPSGRTVASTWFTVTFTTRSPGAPGIAVPVTRIGPASRWIRLRVGDVTFNTGEGPGPLQATAVARNRTTAGIERSEMGGGDPAGSAGG